LGWLPIWNSVLFHIMSSQKKDALKISGPGKLFIRKNMDKWKHWKEILFPLVVFCIELLPVFWVIPVAANIIAIANKESFHHLILGFTN
jgi:hypothetical protein